MKLPSATPIEENFLCRDREEFGELVSRTLEKGSGAFFKVFGKASGRPYYITVLMDREKILAVEAEDVNSRGSIVGRPALEILKDVLSSGPVIVDAFPMTDVEIKMSIVENLDVHNSTPKMRLADMCPTIGRKFGVVASAGGQVLNAVASSVTKGISEATTVTKMEERKPKKPKTKVHIKAPADSDPYFRGMVRHLKNVLKGFGVELKAVEIEAKEVRYALGAGNAIHANIELKTDGKLPGKVKSELESFIYKEAGDISKELGKRVVISRINFS